jgi:ankyrin repeat protein
MLDGYTFYLGVTHFYEAHPVLESSIRPITSLIRDSIFRSNHAISSSDRGSLKIRPLSELIDMFHTHKATDPVDKVYALLGMSSDDPGTAGLLPNYTIPWKELFKDLIKFILGKDISVKTFEDSQRAIIQSKGYILGQVSSVRSDNRQSVKITSRNAAWDLGGKTEWTLQESAKSIQERDIICLLYGASKPTIIRLRNDHFAVVVVAATPLNGSGSFGWPEISQSIKQFVRDFSLVWDWEKPLAKSQDQEEYETLTKIYCQVLEFSKAEFGDQLDRATRLWNDIMILDDLGEYKRADERLLEAKSSYVATFRKEHLPSRNSQHCRTLVSFAAGEGHKDIVKLLLEKGVEADLKDSRSGRGPLSWAAEKGHEGIVILLLENDTVDPDSQDKEGRTPLSLAAGAGHEVVVKLLLKKRVDAESECKQTRTPLWWAVSQGQGAVVKLLLENGVDADWKDWGGMTALSWAAYFGHVAVVKLLLDQGVDTDTKDNAGRTPLMWAIGFKHETVVKVLLENLEKRVGAQKLLLWAAENGYKVIVTLLLENNNVDPDSKDEKGRTPLSWAAEKEHEDIVTLLLENGSTNLDSKDKEGRTPLSFSAEAGHEAIVKLLLAFGVNADSKDNYGWTPLSFAADAGHEAVVKLLLTMRVDANSRDNHGRTPLLFAAENDHRGIVQLLHDTILNSSIQ